MTGEQAMFHRRDNRFSYDKKMHELGKTGLKHSVKGSKWLHVIKLPLMDITIFNKQRYFWQKNLFLITENDVVALANEITLSIENKNHTWE